MRKICKKLNCPFIEICPEDNNYEIIDNCCSQAEKIRELAGVKEKEEKVLHLKTKISKKEIEIERLEKEIEELTIQEKPLTELEEKLELLNKRLNNETKSKKILIKQNNKLQEDLREIKINKLGLKKEGMKKLWQKARDNSEEINGEKYISIDNLKSLI